MRHATRANARQHARRPSKHQIRLNFLAIVLYSSARRRKKTGVKSQKSAPFVDLNVIERGKEMSCLTVINSVSTNVIEILVLIWCRRRSIRHNRILSQLEIRKQKTILCLLHQVRAEISTLFGWIFRSSGLITAFTLLVIPAEN